MPGKPLIFKDFRASLTLVPAGYIASADMIGGGHLPLSLGHPALQAVAAADDVGLPLRQPLGHQAAYQCPVVLVLQVLQHGVAFTHHVADGQLCPVAVGLNGLVEGHLPLQLLRPAEVHEDFIRYPLLTES